MDLVDIDPEKVAHIELGSFCQQTLPCGHTLKVTMKDGKVVVSSGNGDKIAQLFIDAGLLPEMPHHLACYLSKEVFRKLRASALTALVLKHRPKNFVLDPDALLAMKHLDLPRLSCQLRVFQEDLSRFINDFDEVTRKEYARRRREREAHTSKEPKHGKDEP